MRDAYKQFAIPALLFLFSLFIVGQWHLHRPSLPESDEANYLLTAHEIYKVWESGSAVEFLKAAYVNEYRNPRKIFWPNLLLPYLIVTEGNIAVAHAFFNLTLLVLFWIYGFLVVRQAASPVLAGIVVYFLAVTPWIMSSQFLLSPFYLVTSLTLAGFYHLQRSQYFSEGLHSYPAAFYCALAMISRPILALSIWVVLLASCIYQGISKKCIPRNVLYLFLIQGLILVYWGYYNFHYPYTYHNKNVNILLFLALGCFSMLFAHFYKRNGTRTYLPGFSAIVTMAFIGWFAPSFIYFYIYVMGAAHSTASEIFLSIRPGGRTGPEYLFWLLRHYFGGVILVFLSQFAVLLWLGIIRTSQLRHYLIFFLLAPIQLCAGVFLTNSVFAVYFHTSIMFFYLGLLCVLAETDRKWSKISFVSILLATAGIYTHGHYTLIRSGNIDPNNWLYMEQAPLFRHYVESVPGHDFAKSFAHALAPYIKHGRFIVYLPLEKKEVPAIDVNMLNLFAIKSGYEWHVEELYVVDEKPWVTQPNLDALVQDIAKNGHDNDYILLPAGDFADVYQWNPAASRIALRLKAALTTDSNSIRFEQRRYPLQRVRFEYGGETFEYFLFATKQE